MLDGPEAQVACIYNAENIPVGSGILISANIVISCAHVVAEALEIDKFSEQKPEKKISLDFPSASIQPQDPIWATVLEWVPCSKQHQRGQLEDFAILKLSPSISSINYKTLANVYPDLENQPLSYAAFGYSTERGIWSKGEGAGGNASGWIQGDEKKRDILPGCSGGAVFNQNKQYLLGMIVAREKGKQITYFIPVDAFKERLSQYLPSSRNAPTSHVYFISDQDNKRKQQQHITDLSKQIPSIQQAMQKVCEIETDNENIDCWVLAEYWTDIQSDQQLIQRLKQLFTIARLTLANGRHCDPRVKQGLWDLHSYTLALSNWIREQTQTFINCDGIVESTFMTAAFNEAGLAAQYNLSPRYDYNPETGEVRGKYANIIEAEQEKKWQQEWPQKINDKNKQNLNKEELALAEKGWNEEHIAEHLLLELATKLLKPDRTHLLSPFNKTRLKTRLKNRRAEEFKELHRLEAKISANSIHALNDPKVCKILKEKIPELPVIRHTPGEGEDVEAEILTHIEDFYILINEHCKS